MNANQPTPAVRAAEETPLRMEAYYYGFTPTGNRAIDLILCAVASAGKSFHHTEQWRDECQREDCQGDCPVEWIQIAANNAAAIIAAHVPASDEETISELIKERDHAEDWADKLAAAISDHTGHDIGEHSNMNSPWEEALEAISAHVPADTSPSTMKSHTPAATHHRTGNCPLEGQVAHAFDEAGVIYEVDGEPGNKTGLDFRITAIDVYVEVKSAPTPRIADQMNRRSNIIVLQGKRSVNLFCHMIRNQKQP